MNTDSFTQFKANQRESWAHFAPLEVFTTAPAGCLVEFAQVKAGEKVLDVACGTGVVAITASRLGADVYGLDLSPVLLTQAKENAQIAQMSIEFLEGDVENLPYPDATFDVVLSQFGHMFAPRPEVTIAEMLRVLKPHGRMAFSTWPPEMFMARMFALSRKYMPFPDNIPFPELWGEPLIIRERLANRVKNLFFDRQMVSIPSLSPEHTRKYFEATSGPLIKMQKKLSETAPEKLIEFQREFEALIIEYRKNNLLQQHYLMTRAYKIE